MPGYVTVSMGLFPRSSESKHKPEVLSKVLKGVHGRRYCSLCMFMIVVYVDRVHMLSCGPFGGAKIAKLSHISHNPSQNEYSVEASFLNNCLVSRSHNTFSFAEIIACTLLLHNHLYHHSSYKSTRKSHTKPTADKR
jgi:hypothetical protein